VGQAGSLCGDLQEMTTEGPWPWALMFQSSQFIVDLCKDCCGGAAPSASLWLAPGIGADGKTADVIMTRISGADTPRLYGASGSGDRFPSEVERAVARFGAAVAPLLRARVGQSEANLTSSVETLLRDVAGPLGLPLLLHREASEQSLGIRPDLAVDVAGARAGVVELKAPGMGVPGTPR